MESAAKYNEVHILANEVKVKLNVTNGHNATVYIIKLYSKTKVIKFGSKVLLSSLASGSKAVRY